MSLLVRVVLLASASAMPLIGQASDVDFVRDIEPVLSQHCVSCHNAASQAGGLRLDNRADAERGGNSGTVIEPGSGATSLLVKMLSRPASDGPSMPLGGPRLPDATIRLVAKWIDQGAPWPDSARAGQADARPSAHWSFVPLERPAVPSVRRSD